MSIAPANAAAAYGSVGRIQPRAAAQPSAQTPAGASFANLVREAAGSTLETMRTAEQASLRALTGNADIGQVVTAVANAETSLQAAVAVRDRVISAYQDIMRMPI